MEKMKKTKKNDEYRLKPYAHGHCHNIPQHKWTVVS